DDLAAREALQPALERAATAVVLEVGQLAREHLEALVAHLLGVGAREPVRTRVAFEQRRVELEELLPGLAIAAVAHALEQRPARRAQGCSSGAPAQRRRTTRVSSASRASPFFSAIARLSCSTGTASRARAWRSSSSPRWNSVRERTGQSSP